MENRRGFLGRVMSLGFAFTTTPWMRTFAAQETPRLRIGILSDIHVREKGWTLDPFVAALKWFDMKKVDVVIIAGDLADFGMVEQLKTVGDAWDAIFPGDRASEGRKVEKVFVTGNHDHHFYNHAWMKKRCPDDRERFNRSIAKDFNAAWITCFHEEYRPFHIKEIKGYSFIAYQYGEKGVEDYMASLKGKLDPHRPFFYVQHQHPKDTCYGPDAWGHDKGDSTKALSKFPNCIAFSGHSHYSLVRDDGLWKNTFVSIGSGSLRYAVIRGENGKSKSDYSAHQGMLAEVFDDRIVLNRMNFPDKGEPYEIGSDWVVSGI